MDIRWSLLAAVLMANVAMGQAADTGTRRDTPPGATAPGPMGTVDPDPDTGCKTTSKAETATQQAAQSGQKGASGAETTSAMAKKPPPCP